MNNSENARERRRRRRGMYLLPSFFTAINIAAGYFAITQSLQGSLLEPRHFDYAALAIGFESSIRKEWAWRIKRGESTANLRAFARFGPGTDQDH